MKMFKFYRLMKFINECRKHRYYKFEVLTNGDEIIIYPIEGIIRDEENSKCTLRIKV